MADTSRAQERQSGIRAALYQARLAHMIDAETGSTLRLALITVGASCLFYIPVHLSSHAAGARLLALVTSLIGVTFLTGWLWTRTHPVPTRLSQPVFALVILITASSAIYSQAVAGDEQWTTNMSIIMIGVGMCIVGWRWSLATALAAVTTWLVFAAPPLGSASLNASTASLVFSCFAACIINTGRRNSLVRVLQVTEEAERAAVIDSLTQVYNRRGLQLVASHLVLAARRAAEPVGAIVVDVDGFKSINDRLGHQAGDHVLAAVAGALESCARESDVVARWGGDEFVVITLGAAPDAEDLARRLEDDLRARGVVGGDGGPVCVSVGAANVAVANPVVVDELITQADAAMYAGRARRRHGEAASEPLEPRQHSAYGR